MVSIRALFPASLLSGMVLLAACSTGGDVGVSQGAQPRLASWSCTGGVRLTIARTPAGLDVTDSRGITVSLPPDPPGQRERYAKTGYALVFAGRTASWFAGGQAPADCRR